MVDWCSFNWCLLTIDAVLLFCWYPVVSAPPSDLILSHGLVDVVFIADLVVRLFSLVCLESVILATGVTAALVQLL